MTGSTGFSPSRNLIVTGIPRAGTTLTSALIDGMENAVCINEPKWQSAWSREGAARSAYVQRIADDFAAVRAALLAGDSIDVRASGDGSAVTNFFDRSATGRKRKPLTVAPMSRPGLAPDFLLAMKHNAHYACVLDELAALPDFSVLAIVRNPVATLLSWRSLSVPVSKGRMPAAEPYWPEIAEAAQGAPGLLVVQARIIELLFQRFHMLREKIAILRLEDIIASPQALNDLLGRRQRQPVAITPSNLMDEASATEIGRLRSAVIAHCPTAAKYYPDLS
jgi:hypothetical protein